MAKFNYLVSGLPGTGKTTICNVLRNMGYNSVDADIAYGYRGDPVTGMPTSDPHQLSWLWESTKIDEDLSNQSQEYLFICGSATNRDQFIHRFQKVFILKVDDATLKTRILGRTEHNFGKDPEVLARQLRQNKGVEDFARDNGYQLIDATMPPRDVVNQIISSIPSR